MASKDTRELYVSVDVEADGSIPGEYSMLSLGACAAARRDKDGSITVLNPDDAAFYVELQPVGDRFDADALAVASLDRDHLVAHGTPPATAMRNFVDWVKAIGAEHRARPVFAAYPLGFDWLFTYWYCMRFAGESPFGHSAHYDMKTAYATLAGTAIRDAVKRRMPPELLGDRPHTHNALDDAKGQADLCAALLQLTANRRERVA